jgi:hypothetical protein
VSRVYAPTYAVDLAALSHVWGGGRVAPIDDWPRLLTPEQRELVGWDLDGMHTVLRRVADGDRGLEADVGSELRLLRSIQDRFAAGTLAREDFTVRAALNVRHAVELWCSWLGRRVDFIQDHHRWLEEDSETETLEWLAARGVPLGVGFGQSPWPVPVTVEAMLVRTMRAAEIRDGLAQMRAVKKDVPLMMWREHKALLALFEERARDGTDLVEIAWF